MVFTLMVIFSDGIFSDGIFSDGIFSDSIRSDGIAPDGNSLCHKLDMSQTANSQTHR